MPGLQFRAIRKSFGAVHALRGVSFDVTEGEAHAIVGENGAGKSTLLKVLAGLVRPDAGHLQWRDRPLEVASPHDAIEHGIGMVYQEMLTFPNLSVTANIFAGRELRRYGRLREQPMRQRTREILDRLALDVDPDALAGSLSAAHRQLLQVARALAFTCDVLVLDEPTTTLTDAEADHLFEVLEDLRRGGTTLIYVSHRLAEVFRLCQRITVLRDGTYVDTFDVARTQPAQIVRAMVGRDLPPRGRGSPATAAGAAAGLELRGLSRHPWFDRVSLQVARGEIVGLFGLVGSGRSELLETVFGVHPPTGGDMAIEGRALRPRTPRDAGQAGVGLVPEERQRQGLLFNLDVRHNLVLARANLRADWLLHAADERAEAAALVRDWRIKTPGIDAAPDSLSGGNQQKVVVARWLATCPRVLLLDEPTKGVDVGAKFEIHDLIRAQARQGLAVLMASSDLPEVLALADRIVVMREGRVQGQLLAADATEESVMHLATSAVAS